MTAGVTRAPQLYLPMLSSVSILYEFMNVEPYLRKLHMALWAHTQIIGILCSRTST